MHSSVFRQPKLNDGRARKFSKEQQPAAAQAAQQSEDAACMESCAHMQAGREDADAHEAGPRGGPWATATALLPPSQIKYNYRVQNLFHKKY